MIYCALNTMQCDILALNDFKEGIEFLKNSAVNPPQEGKYLLESGGYASVFTYQTKTETEAKFETHQKYIDIQMLLEGSERLDWAPVSTMEERESYNDEKDVAFQKETATTPRNALILYPSVLAILYPDDSHRPGIANGTTERVRKIVLKIPVCKE